MAPGIWAVTRILVWFSKIGVPATAGGVSRGVRSRKRRSCPDRRVMRMRNKSQVAIMERR